MNTREIYAFLLGWYEDARKVKADVLKKLYMIAPFRGIAYRRTGNAKLGLGSSWSTDLRALDRLYNVGKLPLYRALVVGIDVAKLVNEVIHLDPKNSDLQDLRDIKEVIALKTQDATPLNANYELLSTIRFISTAYNEALADYDDVPNLQHNFNDDLRQGTGDPVEELNNQMLTDKELEEALTFPNTDYIGEHPVSDINLGVKELYKIEDFKLSAPYSSSASKDEKINKKLARLKARRQGLSGIGAL